MRGRSAPIVLGVVVALACGSGGASGDGGDADAGGGSSGSLPTGGTPADGGSVASGGTAPNGGVAGAGASVGGTTPGAGSGADAGASGASGASTGGGGQSGSGSGAGAGGSGPWSCQSSDAVCICGPVMAPNATDCGTAFSCCIDYVSDATGTELEVCACDDATEAECTERALALYRGRREATCPP